MKGLEHIKGLSSEKVIAMLEEKGIDYEVISEYGPEDKFKFFKFTSINVDSKMKLPKDLKPDSSKENSYYYTAYYRINKRFISKRYSEKIKSKGFLVELTKISH